MFAQRRAARAEQIRELWQRHLTDAQTDRTDPEAIRQALVEFIIKHHIPRKDAERLIGQR